MKSQYITNTAEDGNTYRMLNLELFNAGVGPAFIESADWTINNKPITHVKDIANLFPEGLQAAGEYQGQYSQLILAPGESETVWEVAFPMDPQSLALTQEFMQSFWAMDMQVCYCSLYEQCWVSQYNAKSPRPKVVTSCPTE
jgi:hypothetical protein